VEEVRRLKAQGKADRDIIVELKKEGHSFQDIEKAMLQVMRTSGPPGSPQQPMGGTGAYGGQGFSQGQPQASRQQYNPQQGVFNAGQQFNAPGARPPPPGYSQPMAHAAPPNLATRETLIQQPNLNVRIGGTVPLEAEAGNPTDLIEEVVEGVVEEKFEEADKRFETASKDMVKTKEDLENLKNLMLSSLQKKDKSIDELKANITSLKEEIEDVVIKCNALEKAFKQFLPELTEKVRTQNTEKKVIETTEA